MSVEAYVKPFDSRSVVRLHLSSPVVAGLHPLSPSPLPKSMFSNLGLFARQPCPDGACLRPRCIFNHSGSSQSSASAEDRSLKRQRSSAATSVSTAKVASSSTPRIPATVGSSATPALLRSRQPLMGTTAQPASTNSVPPKVRCPCLSKGTLLMRSVSSGECAHPHKLVDAHFPSNLASTGTR